MSSILIEGTTCGECEKEISWDEYVVNWGSCSDCFDAHVNAYFRDHPDDTTDSTERDTFDWET